MEHEIIQQLAEDLRKQQKYTEATQQYEILWNQNRLECSEWDGWGYAFCLRKIGQTTKALEICREVYKLKPDFEYIRSLYGWCVYDLEIKKSDEEIKNNENNFFKAAKAVIDLTSPGQFSPYIRTIFKVVDYLKNNRQNYPARAILDWLEKLSPEMLSTECGTGKDKEGKSIEYASDFEKWYSEKCKALFEANQYEECLRIGQEALSKIKKFHTDNDVWFRYRIALVKGNLGDKEEAIQSLKNLLLRKRDWFLLMEISKMYFDLSELDSALKFASEAALAPGPKELNFRWELYMLLGEILQAQNNLDQAKEHILLALKLRQEKGWKEITALSSLIVELQVDANDGRSTAQIQKNLMGFWKGIVHVDKKQISGKIKNLVGEGRSGFIIGDDGKDYYFKVKSFQHRQSEVKPGMRVRFFIQPSNDQRCDSAVDIELQ